MAGFEIFVQWAIVTALLVAAAWYVIIKPSTMLLARWGVIPASKLDEWQGYGLAVSILIMGVVAAMEITYPAHRQAAVLTQSGELIRLPHGGIDRLLPEGKIVTIKEKISCGLWQIQAHLPGSEVYVEIHSPVDVELTVADPDLFYRVKKDDADWFQEFCQQVRSVLVVEIMSGRQSAYGWRTGDKVKTPKEQISENRARLAQRLQARLEQELGMQGVKFEVSPSDM